MNRLAPFPSTSTPSPTSRESVPDRAPKHRATSPRRPSLQADRPARIGCGPDESPAFRRTMKTPRCVSLLLLGLAATAVAADPVLDATIAKFAKRLPAGGIVAAEFDATSVSYTSAGGFAPAPGIAPEKVIFEIGSITKVFTALLLAETVQEGKARLDDPIAKHLPAELKLSPEVAAITLEQLSTHTSGLPRMPDNWEPKNMADPYADYGTKELHALLPTLKLEKPAPQPAEYSNLGQGLLGHILSRIHGRSYEQLVAERIAAPLGLKDTVITLDAEQQARFAPPYSGAKTASPWTFDALAGAGAIRSTAADMARLGQALMSPGDTPLQRAWDLVRQPRTAMDAAKLGLAVAISTVDGATTYSHGGGTGGFRTHVEFSPEKKRGLVILINNDALEPAGIPGALREARLPAAAKPAREELPLPPEKLRELTGVYALNPKVKFTLLIGDEGRLLARLTGQPFLPLYHAGNDRFFYRAVPAEIQFARGAGGTVASLTLHQNGRELPATRTAEALPVVLFPTAAEIGAYVGDYELAPGAIFEVKTRGPQLFAKLTGQPEFPVFKERADYFTYDVVEAALAFERDAEGKVVALVLHQNGQTPRAKRIK